MTITASSWAAGVATRANNTQFANAIEILERKHLLIGAYDPAKTAVVDNVPVQIRSAADAEDQFGAGSQLHRMALAANKGHFFDVETWALPCPDDVAAAAATGTLTLGGPATAAGTLALYIGNDRIPIAVAKAATATAIGDLIDAYVLAHTELPVTSNNVAGVVTFTAKTKGTHGNGIAITLNWGVGEALPAGVTAVVVDMAAGATDPDIDDALAGLGDGDLANLEHFTDVNVGWGLDDTTVIAAISTYNGSGNLFTGLYDPLIARPFRNLWGDTVADAAGLTALEAIADAHRDDRTSGVIAAPGSPVHPVELACQTMAILARLNSTRAEETALNQILTGIIPGATADMWTAAYDSRDEAVQNGISTTLEKGGSLTVQNVLTFYRPVSVPIASNGYRSQRNISIVQNMLNAMRTTFETEKWNGVSIVEDVTKVSNATSRAKARDVSAVMDDLFSLADQFGARAWIYSAAWTKEKLAEGGLVTIRSGANGFDATLPVLLSGEAGIFDGTIEFDTSLAVVLG